MSHAPINACTLMQINIFIALITAKRFILMHLDRFSLNILPCD